MSRTSHLYGATRQDVRYLHSLISAALPCLLALAMAFAAVALLALA